MLSVSFSGEIRNVKRGQLMGIVGGIIVSGLLLVAIQYFSRAAIGDQFHQGRGGHTATLLPDGRVLVAGGSGNFMEAELYDPSTAKWTVTGSTAEGGFGHMATLLADAPCLSSTTACSLTGRRPPSWTTRAPADGLPP